MKPTTPLHAIRLHCLDCSAGSSNEVNLCAIPNCSLYEYRFGKRPVKEGHKKRKVSEKTLLALKNARISRNALYSNEEKSKTIN